MGALAASGAATTGAVADGGGLARIFAKSAPVRSHGSIVGVVTFAAWDAVGLASGAVPVQPPASAQLKTASRRTKGIMDFFSSCPGFLPIAEMLDHSEWHSNG